MASLAAREPPIPAAKLLWTRSHRVPNHLLVTELFFQVPLDYFNPTAGSLTLFGRCVSKYEKHLFGHEDDDLLSSPQSTPASVSPPPKLDPAISANATRTSTPAAPGLSPGPELGPWSSIVPSPCGFNKPFLVYLEGGPGFGNREPQDHPLTHRALARGYQVLFLDHRGTGLSSPVSAEMLARLPNGTGPRAVQVQAHYLEFMRQDSTVRDCEAVRKTLTVGWPENRARWSLFGQSYGGFVSLSYLSLHPEGLREVFLTGGLAPVGRRPDEVYAATYRKTIERNLAYWSKFPEDARNLAQIIAHIETAGGKKGLPLPGGGFLTVQRLLTLGLRLGFHGGLDHVHAIIVQLKSSLDQHGFLNRSSLTHVQDTPAFDVNPIYALLHEAIYCDAGPASNWSAYRVGQALEQFPWLRPDAGPRPDYPIFFSGEMIYPFFFDVYAELIPLKAVAEKLAAKSDWPPLYDQEQLRRNQIPVYAACFIEDMFVDYAFSKETAKMIRGIKTFDTNVMYHTALHAKTEEVITQLFHLRDDTLD